MSWLYKASSATKDNNAGLLQLVLIQVTHEEVCVSTTIWAGERLEGFFPPIFLISYLESCTSFGTHINDMTQGM